MSDELRKIIQNGYDLPDAYFEAKVGKATTVEDINTVLTLQQLTDSRFDDFHVNTEKVRGTDTLVSLEKRLNANPLTPYSKLLFSGFPGSGKTTELIRLLTLLQKNYHVIILSAKDNLNVEIVTIKSLMHKILYKLLDSLKNDRKRNIKIARHYFSEEPPDRDSFKTNVLKEFNSKTSGSNNYIHVLNKLLDSIAKEAAKETVIIIDDFGKISPLVARDQLLKDYNLIMSLHCKMILSFPMELVGSPMCAVLQEAFGKTAILPPINIKNKKGKPHQQGLKSLTGILERRVELSLFENNCYKEAVKYSGGSIKQLFQIVREAASIEKLKHITTASMKKAIDYYKNNFSMRIENLIDEFKFSVVGYLEVMQAIYQGNETSPEQAPALRDLLGNGAVIKNVIEDYYTINPLLEDFLKNHPYYKPQKESLVETTRTGEVALSEPGTLFSQLNIKKYNAMENVIISNLKRINIFAGINNSGKSTLLEAIYLLIGQNDVNTYFETMRRRGKFTTDLDLQWLMRQFKGPVEIEGVFHDKPAFVRINREEEEKEAFDKSSYMGTIQIKARFLNGPLNTKARIFKNSNLQSFFKSNKRMCHAAYSSPFSMQEKEDMVAYHDKSVETRSIDRIFEFLRTNVDSGIEKIEYVGERERFMVSHKDFEQAVDLTQFGEGVQRAFHITLQFAAARNGVLLIDEFENAIHYGLLKNFVNFIRELAEEFNTQVFLTSHSKECIEAI